jgi:hypothetical protein
VSQRGVGDENIDMLIKKRINTLHTTCQKITLGSFLGVLVPPLLFLLAGLGLWYKKWTKDAFKQPDIESVYNEICSLEKQELKQAAKEDSIRGKVAYLFLNQSRFLFPVYLVAIVIIGVIAMGIGLTIAEKP